MSPCLKIDKSDRQATLQTILSVSAFNIENFDFCLKALRSYEQGQADFSDYLIQKIAAKNGYTKLLTFAQKAPREKGFQGVF
ncbi:MAG: hypothetical protein EA365_10215 [Gloeocapsa sp. DLM2.Bin57]|nr:MAG: hypothetical protein EA365_10215 [Gloeocapsa sp. DLM2.Bin57]